MNYKSPFKKVVAPFTFNKDLEQFLGVGNMRDFRVITAQTTDDFNKY